MAAAASLPPTDSQPYTPAPAPARRRRHGRGGDHPRPPAPGPDQLRDQCLPQASKLPDHVLEAVFAFLELPDLQKCSLVCKNWFVDFSSLMSCKSQFKSMS